METFRTLETQKSYDEYKASHIDGLACWICEKVPLQTFSHWRIVENSFPYDRIAAIHHMLVPIRHIREFDLTAEELREFAEIKNTVLNMQYEFLQWVTVGQQSVPKHYHIHLLVSKHKYHSFEAYHNTHYL